MKKFGNFILLPFLLFVSELIEIVIGMLLNSFISNNTLWNITISIVSLVLYYIIGSKFFCKVKNDKMKVYSLCFTVLLILGSCILSIVLSYTKTDMFLFHLTFCTPVANTLVSLFPVDKFDYLYEVLIVLFSPLSVLFTWMFSKANGVLLCGKAF